MNGLYFGRNVDGGTFPADIWGDYMKRVKGGFCGDWPAPTQPFQSAPFHGRYATSGGKLIGAPEDQQDQTSTDDTHDRPVDGHADARRPDRRDGAGPGHRRVRPDPVRGAAAAGAGHPDARRADRPRRHDRARHHAVVTQAAGSLV